jgi:hypothetical protein
MGFVLFSAVPTVLYGCETWALNRSDKRKIETTEIKFLRRVAGFSRKDKISNLTIRSELKIFNINDKITNKKKEWHYHIQLMDPYTRRIVHKAAEYKSIRHRNVGRPKRRWKDDF